MDIRRPSAGVPVRDPGGVASVFVIGFMVDSSAAGVPLDQCPGGMNSMTFAHATRRVVLKGLACTAVAGGTALVGCSPAEVGSNPSTKAQISENVAKEAEAGQSGQAGKKGGPMLKGQSVKRKLFAPGS
jgi:hypothetical protein